ncbi:membrane protein, putative [Babesia bigemina]|uniref:Membrane protein, putative n=1 Tax=Babesia bigemina TaxID=5866 RepID=A0A061D0N6_BABBI|nr:membrane protein, putative [Babesia bigemina]CDR94361.1 membrane protein, putative [Babesia bigemina]|eukprot:XP_012766547.1 membrane protein, putative [Babesia bigemina]
MTHTKIPSAVVAALAFVVASRNAAASTNGENRVSVIYVENEGPYEIKCKADENIEVVDAFGICMEDFLSNKLDAKTLNLRLSLSNAFTRYCTALFRANQPCILNINKKKPGPDRFNTTFGLECQHGNVFVGLYSCCAKASTSIAQGEEVVLYKEKSTPLTPLCPSGTKISVLNAGQRGTVMCDKGHITSTLTRASDKCNGKELCSIPFDESQLSSCTGSSASHFVKYICE